MKTTKSILTSVVATLIPIMVLSGTAKAANLIGDYSEPTLGKYQNLYKPGSAFSDVSAAEMAAAPSDLTAVEYVEGVYGAYLNNSADGGHSAIPIYWIDKAFDKGPAAFNGISEGVTVTTDGAWGFYYAKGSYVPSGALFDGNLTSAGRTVWIGSGGSVSGIEVSGALAGSISGITTNGTLSGTGLTNTGSITGGEYGVEIRDEGIVSGITNSGTILGGTAGVLNEGIIDGDLTNTGTIDGGILNAGSITGNVTLGDATLTLAGDNAALGGTTEGSTASGIAVGTDDITGSFTAAQTASVGTVTVNKGSHLTLADGLNWTATANNDAAVNNSGTLTLNNGSSLTGNVTNTGTLALSNEDGTTATISGNVINSGSITLNPSSSSAGNVLIVAGDFTGTAGSSVSIGSESGSLTDKLTISGDLDGEGTFNMNTDIAGLRGDMLDVKGQANGNFDVFVSDTGSSPASETGLQLIQTGGGSADFTLANAGHVVDLGTYQYSLVSDGKGGWSLTPEEQPVIPDTPDTPDEPVTPDTPDTPVTPDVPVIPDTPVVPVVPQTPSISPSTSAVLSMSTVDPQIFNAELNQVQDRISETRSEEHDGAVWAKVMNNRLNASDSAGADYWMGLNGVVIGADHTVQHESGLTTQGVFFSHSHSDVHFQGKGIGGGDVDAYSVGAYASFLHNSGYWLDGSLKVNRFTHDIHGRMSSGGAANGRFNTAGIGGNLKAGKNFSLGGTVITPYASLTAFTTNNTDISLSNGMKAHVAPQRSVLGKTGVQVAHSFAVAGTGIKPWADVGVEREFIKGNKVRVNNDLFENDLSGNRGIYKVGVTATVTKSIDITASTGYSNGAHIESPWNSSLGVNWKF